MRYPLCLGGCAAIVTFVYPGKVSPALTVDLMIDWRRAGILDVVPRSAAPK